MPGREGRNSRRGTWKTQPPGQDARARAFSRGAAGEDVGAVGLGIFDQLGHPVKLHLILDRAVGHALKNVKRGKIGWVKIPSRARAG